MRTKPAITPELIDAWLKRKDLLRESARVLREAETLFSIPDVALRRPDIYRRADALYKMGQIMKERAERLFKHALDKTFGTRYRMMRRDNGHIWVWAHPAKVKEETRLVFHPSLRMPIIKPKDFIKTFEDALKAVDSKRK
jgi:hypothetical protein